MNIQEAILKITDSGTSILFKKFQPIDKTLFVELRKEVCGILYSEKTVITREALQNIQENFISERLVMQHDKLVNQIKKHEPSNTQTINRKID